MFNFHSPRAVVRLRITAFLFFFVCLPAMAEPVIWFCPFDSYPRSFNVYVGSPQYMDLFVPNADWSEAAKRISVFKIYSGWVTKASDDELRKQFSDLHRRGIALALEFGPLTHGSDCASGIVGESSGGQLLMGVAQRIQKDGGDLKYIAMDEPLFFSASPNKKQTCSWSADQVASDAAKNLLPVKAIFPNVQFGDVEPLGADHLSLDQEIPRYHDGIEAFQKAFGAPLAFFQLDITWHAQDLPTQLKQVKAMLASENVPMGVIYDGSSRATSDKEWLDLAAQHSQQVESAIGAPAMVIFQTWHAYPKKLIPESDPDSFTHLIRDYHSQ